MQHTPVTIEEAASQFKTWHQNKRYKFEPIPSYLKDLVKHLLPHYPKKEIIRHLRITGPTISSIEKQNTPSLNQNTNHSQEQNLGFIPFQLAPTSVVPSIDASTPTVHHKQENITCQIIKTNGTKLIIQTSDTNAVIQAFLCYS
jgi:hypothetical protein